MQIKSLLLKETTYISDREGVPVWHGIGNYYMIHPICFRPRTDFVAGQNSLKINWELLTRLEFIQPDTQKKNSYFWIDKFEICDF
jgi:hypothetical protein